MVEAILQKVPVTSEVVEDKKASKPKKKSAKEAELPFENEVELNIAIEDLQQFINELPEGCKVVFNLYVIEGYKHIEIAEMLKIAEGTSKTQLSRARKALQKMISLNQKTYHEKSR